MSQEERMQDGLDGGILVLDADDLNLMVVVAADAKIAAIQKPIPRGAGGGPRDNLVDPRAMFISMP